MKFRTIPIGAAFDVKNGATPKTSETSYWDGDVAWVGPIDLGKLPTRYIRKGVRNITRAGYDSCGTQMVSTGTIILSIRAPIGHIAITSGDMCFNQGCRGLVPRSIINSEYGYWALLSLRPQLEAGGQGTTFTELSRSKLRTERIFLPNLDTQNFIADFLDCETGKINQLIEKKTRFIEIIKEKRAKLIAHAMNKGIDRNFNENQDRFERNEDHWLSAVMQFPQSQVKRHLDVKLGKMLQSGQRNPKDKLLPYLRAANIGWGQIDYTDIKKMWFSQNDHAEYILRPGDMVVTEGGNSVGQAAIVNEMEGFTGFQNSIHRVRPKRGENIRFAFYWMRYLKDCGYIDLVCSKATLAHFTAEKFMQSPFPSVDLDMQEAIVDFLDHETRRIDNIVAKTMRSIELLKEKRLALITSAVTGKIDTKSILS